MRPALGIVVAVAALATGWWLGGRRAVPPPSADAPAPAPGMPGARSTGEASEPSFRSAPGRPAPAEAWAAPLGGESFAELPARRAPGPGGLSLPEAYAGLSTGAWIAAMPEPWAGRARAYRRELARFDPGNRRYLCWGPSTPPEVVALFRRLEVEGGMAAGEVRTLANQFLGSGHWSRTATDGSGQGVQGLGVTVTWSVAGDGTPVPGVGGSLNQPSDMRAWLAGLYGGSASGPAEEQPWFPLFEECFDQLSAQCGVRFVYEPNDDGRSFIGTLSGAGEIGTRGDIRIGGRPLDGPSGTLAFAYAPNYGEVILDTDDSYFDVLSSNSIRLLNVLTHELGHAMGLDHVCPINRTKLMEPFLSSAFRGTRFDEWQSLQRQYGDPLEVEGTIRDNDSAENARDLGLAAGSASAWEWLSLDDNGDLDWFSIDAAGTQQLRVRVEPADEVYLEGPQNFDDSCGGGTSFDASSQQNLALEVRAADGTTILAAADANGPGGAEELPGLWLEEAGRHYIRVAGATANAAQLYRLEVELGAVRPPVDLRLDGMELVAESNAGGNGLPDPGETVRMDFTIRNEGSSTAHNAMATLVGPTGWTAMVDRAELGSIGPDEVATATFTFAQEGECGAELELLLELDADEGVAIESVPFRLGSAGGIRAEGFDAGEALPGDWSSESQAGVAWARVTDRADAGGASAFSPGVSGVSEAVLVSPGVTLAGDGGALRFRHWYEVEWRYDGAVLEASLEGGAWFDLPTAAGVVVETGGYNRTLYNSSNPLSSRPAWTGSSGEFVTTSLALPQDWAGRQIRFRWRLGHDTSVAEAGWWVDSVEVSGEPVSCDPFRPVLTLSGSGQLSERDPSEPVLLRLTTPLPLARDIAVTPEISGDAAAADLVAVPELILEAGSTEVLAELFVQSDSVGEGTESLVLSLPPDQPEFAVGAPLQAAYSIQDSYYGEWAVQRIGEVSLRAPDADADADGLCNLGEYLLGGDPGDPASRPRVEVVVHPDRIELKVPTAVEREDAVIVGETSGDLSTWSEAGVFPTAEGFAAMRTGERRFLRLAFERVEP